jgi:hypothetical protein
MPPEPEDLNLRFVNGEDGPPSTLLPKSAIRELAKLFRRLAREELAAQRASLVEEAKAAQQSGRKENQPPDPGDGAGKLPARQVARP